MTITILPDGVCERCGRYFIMEFTSKEDPDWFEEAVYYKNVKPQKPYYNLMNWIDSGLCGRCYAEAIK